MSIKDFFGSDRFRFRFLIYFYLINLIYDLYFKDNNNVVKLVFNDLVFKEENGVLVIENGIKGEILE